MEKVKINLIIEYSCSRIPTAVDKEYLLNTLKQLNLPTEVEVKFDNGYVYNKFESPKITDLVFKRERKNAKIVKDDTTKKEK